MQPAARQGRHHLPHPAPEGHLVGALVPALPVQDKGGDLQVVQVDARLGQHGQKAVGVLGGGGAAQHGGQPDVEMAQHALGDLGPAQPLVVHGGLQPAEGLLKVVDIGGLEAARARRAKNTSSLLLLYGRRRRLYIGSFCPAVADLK